MNNKNLTCISKNKENPANNRIDIIFKYTNNNNIKLNLVKVEPYNFPPWNIKFHIYLDLAILKKGKYKSYYIQKPF